MPNPESIKPHIDELRPHMEDIHVEPASESRWTDTEENGSSFDAIRYGRPLFMDQADGSHTVTVKITANTELDGELLRADFVSGLGKPLFELATVGYHRVAFDYPNLPKSP